MKQEAVTLTLQVALLMEVEKGPSKRLYGYTAALLTRGVGGSMCAP